ncbi:MAG: radical SAM family RiPP maturation amino acid epimerase [Waterburya sp.]
MTQQTLELTRSVTKSNKDIEQELIDKWMKLEEEQLVSISHIKRFKERYQADPNFRENVAINPEKTIAKYNLKLDLETVKWFLDRESLESQQTQNKPLPSSVQIYLDYNNAITKWMSRWRDTTPESDPRFRAWRERQISRADSEISKSGNNQIVHAPISFELTKGCSVGCWFCGISAPRFSDIFTYTLENSKLWKEVLELTKGICGSVAQSGFCYWATDPLDNPDYEKFICDFHQILGTVPQTTTAQPMKDPTRTRSLLKLSEGKGFIKNRFSILSLKILDRLYEEFTPEELVHVGLVMQNKESLMKKAVAGRSLERNKKNTKNNEADDKAAQTTIACVTGFLFNMVERSVKLISPCKADERWPNGYRIYDEGTFTNVDDLKVLLERMISNCMPLSVRESDIIRFRHDLKFESLIDGFKLSTNYLTLNFRHRPMLRELGEIILKGDKTAEEIAVTFENLGISKEDTFYSLNLMFKRGVLDEESQTKTAL